MNDSLHKLLEYLEPKIENIQENRFEIKSLGNVYETIKEIVELGRKSPFEILDYYDQDFIIKAIKISNHDIERRVERYKTSRYLLINKNQNIRELPQYKEALNYLESLFEYLSSLYLEIELDYETKKNKLKTQELLNKYYLLLKRNNIFIKETEEFIKFLDLCEISYDDKLNVLIFINKCNIKNYLTINDIMITNDIKLSDITNLIEEYKYLINSNYEEIDLDLLSVLKENDEELLNKKKISLINKIDNLYLDKQYDEIIKYYIEFIKLINCEKEFLKQKERFNDKFFKKLVFVMNKEKSLVREYLDKTKDEYKNYVYKNLLSIEREENLVIPSYSYKGMYLYLKKDYVVKTVYTFLENGYVLILGVLDEFENINDFVLKNKKIFNKVFKSLNLNNFDLNERDLILKDKEIEVLSFNTLDVELEDKDAR